MHTCIFLFVQYLYTMCTPYPFVDRRNTPDTMIHDDHFFLIRNPTTYGRCICIGTTVALNVKATCIVNEQRKREKEIRREKKKREKEREKKQTDRQKNRRRIQSCPSVSDVRLLVSLFYFIRKTEA